MKLVPVTLALASAACATKSSSPSTAQEPLKDRTALGEPTPTTAQPTSAAAGGGTTSYVRPDGPTLVVGHRDARYELVLPPRFRSGPRVKAEGDEDKLDEAGAHGIGPDDDPVGMNSIVLFSDPLGLGGDMRTLPPKERERRIALYGDVVRQRFPSASPAAEVAIGPHRAIRVDVPEVVLSGRAPRQGRIYMVLDGTATVSLDCLWTPAYADRLPTACDAVAASLRRVPTSP